jgi:hypothetical protein
MKYIFSNVVSHIMYTENHRQYYKLGILDKGSPLVIIVIFQNGGVGHINFLNSRIDMSAENELSYKAYFVKSNR